MELMFIVPIIAAICGWILASNKNRNVFGWAVLCLILPLCVLILLCLPSLSVKGDVRPETKDSTPDEKTCPYCAETIKAAAVVCKHCGRDLPSMEAAASQEHPEGHGHERNEKA